MLTRREGVLNLEWNCDLDLEILGGHRNLYLFCKCSIELTATRDRNRVHLKSNFLDVENLKILFIDKRSTLSFIISIFWEKGKISIERSKAHYR